jgi:DNA-binding SARP family transcriptional activator
MRVRVLGDLEVLRDGTPVPLGGPKPRALLGLLLAAKGTTVGTERLVDQLWGDEPPPKVLTALQVYVAKLRRSLEPGRGPRDRPAVLVTRSSGYALVLPDDAVDARRFEALVARGGEDALVGALALWQGSPYAGLDAPALGTEARRLSELRLRALEQLWTARLDDGRHGEAVGPLATLVAEHPERERFSAMLVLALYRSGRQADALAALRRVRAHLADELGVDPGTELRDLETAVLRQEAALLSPVPAAPPGPEPPAPAPRRPRDPLAGRADVLARTGAAVARAAAGAGGVLLVTGEPGIGKTRLAAAVAEQAVSAGLRSAWGAWTAEGAPPLWGWTGALPGLAPAAAADDDTSSVTYRLADVVLEQLAHGPGTCLVLDDVQWADDDSQRLLRRVAELVPGAPVLVVVLCREPVPDATPATVATLAALARLGAERIRLAGLAAEEIRALVREQTGTDVGTVGAGRIRERTDGNPFYVGELVRWLAAEGAVSDPAHPAWRAVPDGVRDTVRQRLAELPPAVREAVTAAAVFGQVVDLDLLEAWWEDDLGRLDEALDAALAAGLVTEDGGGDDPWRIRFAHALVRDAVYGDLPPLTRRRLHARAAAVVERCRVGRLDGHAAALAEHYRLAGPAHARSAWTYAERAAHAATAAGAAADAARRLESAAQLQAADPLVAPVEREAVHVAWGTALRRSGRVAEAWAPLREAAVSALARGQAKAAAHALLAVTENVLWSWRTRHAADEDAVALWLKVLDALPAGEAGLRARILAALSVEVMHDPPGGRCEAWADEALALARRHPDDGVRVDVLQVVLNPLRRPDLMPRRVGAADELVALCARRRDERALAVALCKRALNHSAFARPDAALDDLRRAHALAEHHHLATALFVIRLGIAVLLQAAGEWSASEESLTAAESLQATIAMPGAGIGVGLRATALLAQSRPAEAESMLRDVAPIHPSLRDLHALALLQARGADRARAALGPWREQPELPWDYLWLSGTALRALVWSELGDQDAVAELRRRLTPFADRVADGAMAACFLGSTRHALAALAFAVGDLPAARRDATAARDLHRRLGWGPWERLSQRLLDRARG